MGEYTQIVKEVIKQQVCHQTELLAKLRAQGASVQAQNDFFIVDVESIEGFRRTIDEIEKIVSAGAAARMVSQLTGKPILVTLSEHHSAWKCEALQGVCIYTIGEIRLLLKHRIGRDNLQKLEKIKSVFRAHVGRITSAPQGDTNGKGKER